MIFQMDNLPEEMEIQFVESLFPHLDKNWIKEKLQSCALDEIVAVILNQEDEDDPEWQDLTTLRNMFPDHSEDKIYEIYMETGMQGTVDYFMTASVDQVQRVVLPKQFTNSHQNQDRATIEFLHSMFPMFDKFDIECVLTFFGSDVDETISTLSQFSTMTKNDPREKLRMEIESLQSMFPAISRRKLQQFWTRFGLVGAIDRLTQDTWSQRPQEMKSIPEPPVQIHFGRQPNYPKSDTLEKKVKLSKESIMELRSIAQTYLMKRNDCFRRACNIFQRGSTGRAAAGQYASEGHDYTALMNKANKEAADAIFEQGISDGVDGRQVDLHGLTVREAKERLAEYMDVHRGRLKVITGAGHHSINGSRLFQTIQSWFRSQGYVVETGGNGWFFVSRK
jgi:hypothetical protein